MTVSPMSVIFHVLSQLCLLCTFFFQNLSQRTLFLLTHSIETTLHMWQKVKYHHRKGAFNNLNLKEAIKVPIRITATNSGKPNPRSEQHSNSGDAGSPETSSWRRDPRPAPRRRPEHHSSSSGSCQPAGSRDLPSREVSGKEPDKLALGRGDVSFNVRTCMTMAV